MSFSSFLPAVFLGTLPLGDFAIPEHIERSVQQQFTTHKLPGGARVFDGTGPDPGPITFRGTFLGIGVAELSANALGQMRAAGKPITLAWGIYSFTVLIERTAVKVGFHKIDYEVTLLVVPDPPAGQDDQDDEDLGDGETQDTPAAAQEQGQTQVARSASAGRALPTPPVPTAPSDGRRDRG